MNLSEYLSCRRELVDKALDELLPSEVDEPVILHKAMRYSLFAGGKRVRPVLAMAAAEAVGGTAEDALPLAVALECIHTYSLIHDDLPAMDDDDLRRGKPTLHKAYGEAVAILAGDALLPFAFSALSSPAVQRVQQPETLLAVIYELAMASGSRHLVAGQVVDITSEGKDVDEDAVRYIVRGKTGALIKAALTGGARLARASEKEVAILRRFGEDLGMVFQVRDDLLDLEGDPAVLGKAVRKDQLRGKATYPNLLGKEQAEAMVRRLVKSALETIEPLGPKAEPLAAIGKYLGDRES
jgi:geranylgeranyl diphosphate synthase type II